MTVCGKAGKRNISDNYSVDVNVPLESGIKCKWTVVWKSFGFFFFVIYGCFCNFFFHRNVFFVRTIYRAIFIHRMMKKSMKWTSMKWLKTVGKTTWFPWVKSVKNKHSLWPCCFQSCFKTTVMIHSGFNLVSSKMNPVHKNKCVFHALEESFVNESLFKWWQSLPSKDIVEDGIAFL